MSVEVGSSARSGRVTATVVGIAMLAAAMVAIAGIVGIAGQSQTLEMVVLVVGFVLVLPAVALVMSRLTFTERDPRGMLVAAVVATGLVLGMIAILRLASINWGDGTVKSLFPCNFELGSRRGTSANIDWV